MIDVVWGGGGGGGGAPHPCVHALCVVHCVLCVACCVLCVACSRQTALFVYTGVRSAFSFFIFLFFWNNIAVDDAYIHIRRTMTTNQPCHVDVSDR